MIKTILTKLYLVQKVTVVIAMQNELKSMHDKMCGVFWIFRIILNPFLVSGYLRPKGIQEVTLIILSYASSQGVNDTFSPISSKGSFVIIWHRLHILIWNYI